MYLPIYCLIVVYLFLYTYLYLIKFLLFNFLHYGALLGIFSGRINELGTSKSGRWSCHRGGHINGVTLFGNELTFCRAVKKWPYYRDGRITQVVV